MGSGCLACFDKSKAKTTVDVDASKDVLIEEHWSEVRNPSVASEDFWTNTTLDMESNAGVRSQGSVSSINTSNLTVDSQGCGCSFTESAEFVNHGLVLWNQTRQQWVGNKRSESRKRVVREPTLNENVTYENLLGSNKRFHRPIPLEEMVQFLVDVWEEEGFVGAVTRIQDRVKIFLAVLFWMSLFFWVTVTDGMDKGKGKKGSRFK